MTAHVQQQQRTARQRTAKVLQHLSARLQQLTGVVEFASNHSSNPLLWANTSSLITQIETALVSLQVEQLHQQAIAQGVWDFFPTPQPVIAKILSLAQIKPGMKMLEPSAGLGHICQEARKLGVEPDCFEISPLLRRGLLLQGFNVIGDNVHKQKSSLL